MDKYPDTTKPPKSPPLSLGSMREATYFDQPARRMHYSPVQPFGFRFSCALPFEALPILGITEHAPRQPKP